MKHISCLIIAAFSFVCSVAQPKTIELYDLMTFLVPDSLETGNTVNWSQLSNAGNKIVWVNKAPVASNGKLSQKGVASISLYDQTFNCSSNTGPCHFTVFAEGNAKGYDQFSIDHTPTESFKPEQRINFLFSRHLKFRELKRIMETPQTSMFTYEVKMTDKRPFWLAYACVYTPKGNGIYLKVFLNQQGLASLENKEDVPQPKTPDQKLTAAAAALFTGCPAKISNADKNDIQLLSGFKKKTDDIHIYPTDINNDGVEEIFIQEFDFALYGNAGAMTTLYIKNSDGRYKRQEEAAAAYLSVRSTSNKGYPDLIAGGPGFKFAVYRWTGTKYAVHKLDQSTAASDKIIDEVSREYINKEKPGKKKAVNAPLDKAPAPVAVAGSKNGLAFLADYAKSGKDIFSNKDFTNRLKKLMGTDYSRMMKNWDLSTEMVAENGLFYHWGMQAHNGGIHESTIIADLNNNALYVKLLKDEKVLYFSEDGKKTIPPAILAWASSISNLGK